MNISSFTVVKSNPSGTIVRFTVTDAQDLLTTTKMIRAVLCDAIDQWIALERADLDTNGDTNVKGSNENGWERPGEGFSAFTFNYGSKYAEVELTSTSNISATGNLTAESPFADQL